MSDPIATGLFVLINIGITIFTTLIIIYSERIQQIKSNAKRRIKKMRPPEETPEIKLIGKDGNAFEILGATSEALKKAGADKEYIDKYLDEATSGDYDHLLGVSMKYVDII